MRGKESKHNMKKGWYAVYTGFRKEKVVADQLSKKGIEVYLPLLVRTRQYTRKIKEYRIPLISCYVFVCIEARDKRKVLETTYVHGFVTFEGAPAGIPVVEIDLMKRVVGERIQGDVISVDAISANREVELISGALTGLKGKLLKQSGKNHFVVELKTIGYAIRMQVEGSQLRYVA